MEQCGGVARVFHKCGKKSDQKLIKKLTNVNKKIEFSLPIIMAKRYKYVVLKTQNLLHLRKLIKKRD